VVEKEANIFCNLANRHGRTVSTFPDLLHATSSGNRLSSKLLRSLKPKRPRAGYH